MKQYRILYFENESKFFCNDIVITAKNEIEALNKWYHLHFKEGYIFFEMRDENVINKFR